MAWRILRDGSVLWGSDTSTDQLFKRDPKTGTATLMRVTSPEQLSKFVSDYEVVSESDEVPEWIDHWFSRHLGDKFQSAMPSSERLNAKLEPQAELASGQKYYRYGSNLRAIGRVDWSKPSFEYYDRHRLSWLPSEYLAACLLKGSDPANEIGPEEADAAIKSNDQDEETRKTD